MEYYKKRKKLQQIKYGKLLNFKIIQDLEPLGDPKGRDPAPPAPQDISDEDGLTKAYEANDTTHKYKFNTAVDFFIDLMFGS
jgi:hypothetical protein